MVTLRKITHSLVDPIGNCKEHDDMVLSDRDN